MRIGHEHEPLFVERRSDDGQQDGQKDERVDGSKGDDSQVHAEVKDLKDFGLCKSQDQDAAIGQSDARQDLYVKEGKKDRFVKERLIVTKRRAAESMNI